MFVDTHCHIHSSDYPLALGDVFEHAKEKAVEKMICVGTGADDSQTAVDFVQKYQNTWASVGLHPHDGEDLTPEVEKAFRQLVSQPKVVAVGECGLDYFYQNSPKAAQEKALRFQIELALEHNLPLIFHVRDAFDDFWPIFDDYKDVRGVLHSFTDSQENLQKALTRGLFIGVNGIATFTKIDAQKATYGAIPLDHLLLETDAPFLTPVPLRGSINEPANVALVARFFAGIHSVDVSEIAKATTTNATKLFVI